MKRIQDFIKLLLARITAFRMFVLRSFSRHPVTTFVVVLGLLLLAIFVGSTLRRPKPEPQVSPKPRSVAVFTIGAVPKTQVQGKVAKASVVTIVALAPGIVSHVAVKEGQSVGQGSSLISLASNYQGSNPASVVRQIAQNQLRNTEETLDLQKQTIQSQRDLAERSQENVDELRNITTQSVEETRSLIRLNEELIRNVNTTIEALQQTNVGGQNEALIVQSRAQRFQLESGLTQLRQGLRQTEYQSVGENPPGRMAFLQREVALQQLQVQEKTLAIGLETARLQLKLAQVNEASFFPTAPFSAMVDRVHVSQGESVNPGQPLVTLAGTNQTATVVASVPQHIAHNLNPAEPATINLGYNTISIVPSYISQEAITGQLYTIIFAIPDNYAGQVIDGGYVSISLPLGFNPGTTVDIFETFIPLDAVFQTENKAYVFVNENNTAKSRDVQLGDVFGNYVEVISGLQNTDQVILNRTVIANDPIQVTQAAPQNAPQAGGQPASHDK